MPENDTQNPNIETILAKELDISYEGETYKFKIPSVWDQIRIMGIAVQLRKEADPDNNGISLGYDPTTVLVTERLATFKHLVQASSAKWVYSPDSKGQLVMDITKWPDDAPFSEVVEVFNAELARFRGKGA